jgi:hypothetical protein
VFKVVNPVNYKLISIEALRVTLRVNYFNELIWRLLVHQKLCRTKMSSFGKKFKKGFFDFFLLKNA